MDIFGLSVFCLAACILLKLLDAVNADIKQSAVIIAVCIAAGHFLIGFRELSASARELFDRTGLDDGYLVIVIKSLGICYVTQISCDCCRDSGETALASQLELAGKAALLLTALPMFSAAADMIGSLLAI